MCGAVMGVRKGMGSSGVCGVVMGVFGESKQGRIMQWRLEKAYSIQHLVEEVIRLVEMKRKRIKVGRRMFCYALVGFRSVFP